MIKYKHGDVFDHTEDILAHGVNTLGFMGAGVAKGVREQYPDEYRAYTVAVRYARDTNRDTLGMCLIGPPKRVAHLFIQTQTGGGVRRVNYEAMYTSLESLFKKMTAEGLTTVAMPQIGAGLAGGSWDIISKIIEELCPEHIKVKVYTL